MVVGVRAYLLHGMSEEPTATAANTSVIPYHATLIQLLIILTHF